MVPARSVFSSARPTRSLARGAGEQGRRRSADGLLSFPDPPALAFSPVRPAGEHLAFEVKALNRNLSSMNKH
uniref:Uncharacterized protein n=1 Tax=Oryza punctata TaxID=4537 RepID=A0A0E0K3C2_ORYPU